ncbi:MAG: tetratricopeptide repeat protein [Nitrosopumilus sp. B06]|nr:MAG: tetratricopeptide repeat protein [Nitrosopumilus sp. D6]RNJ79956.1 MAG: tetratricopeptide repeat protein [Nitrosopumilus sp. B06]
MDSELAARGRESVINGKYEEALKIYEQAISKDPHNPDLWNGKGTALRSLGRYEEATVCFNHSLELDPRDRDAS